MKLIDDGRPLVIFNDNAELERNGIYFKYKMPIGLATFINITIFLILNAVCLGLVFVLADRGILRFLPILPMLFVAVVASMDISRLSFENSKKRFMENYVFVIDNGTFWALYFFNEQNNPIVNYVNLRNKEGDTARVMAMRQEMEDYAISVVKGAQKRRVTLGILNDRNFKYVFNKTAAIIRLDDLQLEGEDKYSLFFLYRDKDGIQRHITFIKGYPMLREKLEEVGTVTKHNFPFPWLTRPKDDFGSVSVDSEASL